MTLEPANPATGLAVQMQTTDYHMIGWTPRYLVQDLAAAMIEAPDAYKAKVVGVNPQPAPSKQRVLIEMTGNWGQREPMTGEDFQAPRCGCPLTTPALEGAVEVDHEPVDVLLGIA